MAFLKPHFLDPGSDRFERIPYFAGNACSKLSRGRELFRLKYPIIQRLKFGNIFRNLPAHFVEGIGEQSYFVVRSSEVDFGSVRAFGDRHGRESDPP